MTIGYVVCEIGYEYNDEIMHRAEYDDGNVGKPLTVFRTRERAEQEVRDLTIEKWFDFDQNQRYYHNFGEYGYDVSEIFNDVTTVVNILTEVMDDKSFDEIYDSISDDTYQTFKSPEIKEALSKLSKEQQYQIIDCLCNPYATVVEVNIVGE